MVESKVILIFPSVDFFVVGRIVSECRKLNEGFSNTFSAKLSENEQPIKAKIVIAIIFKEEFFMF